MLHLTPTAQIVSGMEELSEEERLKIQAVMACAELDAAASVVSSKATTPMATSPIGDSSTTGTLSRTAVSRGPAQDTRLKQDREPVVSTPSRPPSSMSGKSDVSLPPMEGLSDEERAHIEAVMAMAERDEAMFAPPPEQRQKKAVDIPPGLEDLSEEERQQILAVMAAADAESMAPPPRLQPQPQPMHRSGSAIALRPSPSTSSLRDTQPARPKSAMDRPVEPFSSEPTEIPGLEGLSASEREKILAVMESAKREAEVTAPAAPSPMPKPGPPSTLGIVPVQPPVSPGPLPIPPGMEDLSEEERQKIMAVMASAAMDEQMSLPVTPSAQVAPKPQPEPEPVKEHIITPPEHKEPPYEEELSKRSPPREEERFGVLPAPAEETPEYDTGCKERAQPAAERIEEVTPAASWEKETATKPVTTSAVDTFGAIQEPRRSIPSKSQERPQQDLETSRVDSMEEEIPGVDLSHLSPSEREQILAVMRMAQMDDPGAQRRRKSAERVEPFKPEPTTKPESDKKARQQSMTSSSEMGSPTRESGYGTTSTSYDRELGDYATKQENLYDVLEDASEVRDGAHSRNDSRADDRRDDFDFTYSDVRFSEISDENFDQDRYKVSVRSDSGVVDAVEMSDDQYKEEEEADWAMGRTRMWTTVFEGDESEQPSDEVFHRQSPEPASLDRLGGAQGVLISEQEQMSDYDGDYTLKEIEFDTGLGTSKPLPAAKTAIPWTPMGLAEEVAAPMKRPTPEITVTIHDDRVDSEEEESGSEDDDEYPDKIVAAPIAPTPTYEEVEQERQRQEQFGKEVLQQIQAFGEAADDEFDVQWAKSTLQKAKKEPESKQKPEEITAPKIEEVGSLSDQKQDAPLEISKEEERKNPFLESPEDEDVVRFSKNPLDIL
ncbi:hypothetical protein OESDEN_04548 [Oesophagostomum dentatum]|uniref:Uncharacterized protein n=1 Tax=Oesophagostomum dentatum TaxID=61180 RepID=A0A0B1THC0_OESDE|nr:hypothetical protein OESDEN_04548 [Oesophagostomum dentatum]